MITSKHQNIKTSKHQNIDVFKCLIFLIMFFFVTVLQVNAQQIEITFPQHGATGIAIDAKITMHVNYPFIFDTTSLPLMWTKDSLEDSRGKIWFVYEELYSGSDSSLLISSHVGGLGEVDSVNANLQEIIISNEKSFYYNSNYGLNISGMKLINTQTSQVITIDTVILGLFKTIHEPLRFMGTSFQDIPVTCRDNSFIVHFNDSLPTYQTAQGPIVTIDTVSMVTADSSNDSLIVTYHPINSKLQLINGNKDLKVRLDNNFGDSLLYYLNVHLSRLTGNENDDISFSFKSTSIARIHVYGGPADDLQPYCDTSYTYRVGRKLTLSVPEGNDDYIFERWRCVENPMFFFNSFSDSTSETEIELTCDNIRSRMNFIPVFKRIPLDTIRLISAYAATGTKLCSFSNDGFVDSLDDSTYVFKRNSDFSFCFNDCDSSLKFSNWKINGENRNIYSRCVTQASLNNLNLPIGGISTWEPIPIAEPTPCSTIVVKVTLKGTEDLQTPGIAGLQPVMKCLYNENTLALNFIQDPTDPKKAVATLILPAEGNKSFRLYFGNPVALPPQYEFLSCTFIDRPDMYIGSKEYGGSLSRILEEETNPDDRYWGVTLRTGYQPNCENNFEIVIRPRRCYIEVREAMRYDAILPTNESLLHVDFYDNENNLLATDNPNLLNIFSKKSMLFPSDVQPKMRIKFYEIPYNTNIKFAPVVDVEYGYNFYQWEPAIPITNDPLPNTLGSIQVVSDIIVQAIYQEDFRLESISYQLTSGELLTRYMTDNIDVGPMDVAELLDLTKSVGYVLPSDYAEGYGNMTGEIKFNFNQPLNINNWDPNAIVIKEKKIFNEKRLDGNNITIFKCRPGDNAYFTTTNGECKTISMEIKKDNYPEDGHGIGLTPLSEFDITVDNTLIHSMEGSELSIKALIHLTTRYPKFDIIIDKVRDQESHDDFWVPGDEAYGFLWLGHRNTSSDQFQGQPGTTDRESALRIPSSGTFDQYSDLQINKKFVLESLGPYSRIGMGWIFYEADCDNPANMEFFDSVIEIVDNAAKSNYANEWNIAYYLSLAVDLARLAKALCAWNKDDDITEGGFLSGNYKQGNYWNSSPDDRVGPSPKYSTSDVPPYIPAYHWNYYKQRPGGIHFYFKTILY
ncbi:MAG: hypothetical protein ABFD00_03575 [Chloroherpetonaceae bacterium]